MRGCPDCLWSEVECANRFCGRFVCEEHSAKCIDCDTVYCERCAACITVTRCKEYHVIDENGRCESCQDTFDETQEAKALKATDAAVAAA